MRDSWSLEFQISAHVSTHTSVLYLTVHTAVQYCTAVWLYDSVTVWLYDCTVKFCLKPYKICFTAYLTTKINQKLCQKNNLFKAFLGYSRLFQPVSVYLDQLHFVLSLAVALRFWTCMFKMLLPFGAKGHLQTHSARAAAPYDFFKAKIRTT